MDTSVFIRYLRAKKALDDRSLNPHVWRAMCEGCPGSPRILEVGGGIGTMVERVAAERRLSPSSYHMIDLQPDLIAEARRGLEGRTAFPVELEAGDLDRLLGSSPLPFDLVIANGLMDIVDPESMLTRMRALARPGALFLFSITFDGLTSFQPELDRGLDDKIVEAYHRTMDTRIVNGRPSGGSRSGRHLLGLLPAHGYAVAEAGGSDWVIHPRGGAYRGDEAFLMSCMLCFFEEALAGQPGVPTGELQSWLGARRTQLAGGELSLVVHQLDVLAHSAW